LAELFLYDYYSINIFSPYTDDKHIVSIKIDEKLNKNNVETVDDLAR